MVIPNIQEQLKKKKQPAGVVPNPPISVAVPKKNIPQTAPSIIKPAAPPTPAKVLPKMGGVPNTQKPSTTPKAPFVGGPLAAHNSPEMKAAREKSGLQPVDPKKVPPGGEAESDEAMPSQTGDYTSETDQAKALINQSKQAQIEKEKELFGEGLSAGSQEEEVNLFLDKQKDEKTQLQKQIDQMNQIDQSEFNMSKKDANASMDSMTARFSQDREGVMSANNPMISNKFAQRTTERLNNAQTSLNMRFDQREQLKKQLDDAQKQGKIDLAGQINEELAKAENQIRQEKLKLAEYADQSRTQAFDFLEKAPAGSLAGMDPAMVAESFGVDSMTASVMVSMDKKKMALEARQFEMDELDYAVKMTQIEENIANTKWAGMTPEQKNFEYYKNMIDVDPTAAEEFAISTGIKEKSFFSDFQEEWTSQTTQREAIYQKTGVKAPIKSKYAYDVTPDGGVTFERSAPAGKKLTSRGECGMFVNDIINGGPGLMGDSYASKMAKVNSKEPVAGSAFVEKIGGMSTGHTGIVEKVYKDAQGKVTGFDIRESNYVDRWTVSTAHVKPGDSRWSTIVENGGFYVPGASQAKDVETEMQIGEQETTSTQSMSPIQEYATALSNGDYTISDLKEMGMSKSDIAMVSRAANQLPKTDLQENYMNYAQAIANGTMDVSELKNFGIKSKDMGLIQAAANELSLQGGDLDPADLQNYAKAIANQKLSITDLKNMGFKESQLKQIQSASLNVSPEGLDGLNEKQASNYMSLKGQYRLRPEVADFKAVQSAFSKIKSAENTAAGDLSLIFNYMKMLDPGSVVREGEFANAQNAAGIPTQIINLYNKAKTGKRLADSQKAEFISQSQQIFNSTQKLYKNVINEFKNDAKIVGLPDDIDYTLGDSGEDSDDGDPLGLGVTNIIQQNDPLGLN